LAAVGAGIQSSTTRGQALRADNGMLDLFHEMLFLLQMTEPSWLLVFDIQPRRPCVPKNLCSRLYAPTYLRRLMLVFAILYALHPCLMPKYELHRAGTAEHPTPSVRPRLTIRISRTKR
jgi:hypothetical protein